MTDDEAFNQFVFNRGQHGHKASKRQPILPTPTLDYRVVQGFYPFLQLNVKNEWLTVDEAVNQKKADAQTRRHLLEIYDGKFTYECPTVAYSVGGRCLDGPAGPYHYFSSVVKGPKTALFLGRIDNNSPKGALDVERYDSAHWITADGVEHWVVCDCRRVFTY